MRTFTIILITLLGFSSAKAQWTNQTDINTPVTVSANMDDLLSIGTSTGGTYVVFWESIDPPANYELRVQLLDANGNVQFGPNGMLVSNQIPMSTYTVQWEIKVDAQDNLYIGVTGTATGANEPAYVFKMDNQGNHLWGTNGINVGNGQRVSILPLSSGEAIVSWLDTSVYKAALQKIDANGNILWSTNKYVENGSDLTSPADLFELSNGSFVEIFHVLLQSSKSYLYAQRFDAAGNTVWNAPTQLTDKVTAYNKRYSNVQIGDTIYYGYSETEGFRFDSHLQRLDPDGSLPWGINGVDFDVTEDDYEFIPQIAHHEGSQYIWAICTYTDNTQGLIGEFVQKFDKETGARKFTDNAKEIYPVGSSKFHEGALQLSSDGKPLFLMVSETNNVTSFITELSVVKLDSLGDFVFANEMIPIATADSAKSRISFNRTVNNQNVAIFKEQKANDAAPQIYAQNFVDQSLSVKEQNYIANTIRFENPVQHRLEINSEFAVKSVVVYDISGKRIYQKQNINQNSFIISTSSWNSGIYLMTVETNKGTANGMKVIKH